MQRNAFESIIDADLFDFTPPVRTEPGISGIEVLEMPEYRYDPRLDLRIESHLLSHAYAYNKILSLSNSRTRILAHQVESTHLIVNSLHRRFIIADEVGLGKTVEAGLVIKELIFRSNISRILIVAPASLLVQWQHELEEKFGENFEIIDRKTVQRARAQGKTPWELVHKGICSIDFIKNAAFAEELQTTRWDAVIFDEAHRLRRDAVTSTLAYTMAELVSERCDAMILLSATPFRGKLEELYYLIRLVDRNLLGPFQSFYNDYCMPDSDLSRLKNKLSSVMIRRTKKEVGGFTIRHARTIRFELHPEERELYDATTRYVAEEFNKAMQSENRAVGFIMTVFQKLLDSSSYALLRALSNRRENLNRMLSNCVSLRLAELEYQDPDDIEEPELAVDEGERTEREIKNEIDTLTRLIELAGRITRNKKGEKLCEMIAQLKREGHQKFLIFTQFKTTQDYLKEILSPYRVSVFHGSMDKDEKEEAIERFKGDDEVLICTEAGGEGRNMQFCSILFNYDLPWSPLKIEQRIGRIHRFGQKHDVMIYNFSTKDTVAERVLDVLSHKLHMFEESIGTPDIMLGQIEDELKLSNLFMKLTSKLRKKDVVKQIDHSVERARRSFEKLEELSVTQRMDFNYDEYYRITQRERKFSSRQLESFMRRFTAVTGEREIRDARDGLFTVESTGRQGTFDSDRALADSRLEFLAFGHPVIDAAVKHCQRPDFGGRSGVRVISYDTPLSGFAFFFLVTYRSMEERRELRCVYADLERDLPAYKLEDIEHEILHGLPRPAGEPVSPHGVRDCYERATSRLEAVLREKIWEMKESVELSVDPEMENIREAHEREMKELSEKLDRQESTMALTGRDMRSAIARTRKRMRDCERETENALARCRRYQGIQYTASLEAVAYVRSENA